MSTEKDEQKETMIMIETILVQFDKTVNAQEALNHQMNHKTSKIIFFGSLAIILLCISLAFIGWSLKQNAETMNHYMQTVAIHVSAMNNNIEQTQTSMNDMNKGISRIATHIQSVTYPSQKSSITQSNNSTEVLLQIANSIQLMQSDVSGANKSINQLNYNLDAINKQIKHLNRSLRGINQDSRMPSPSRMFPF